MAGGGQWAVVGGGKPKKNKTKSDKKDIKKDEKTNGVSNFVTAGPISESKTVFNAFLEKEKKEQLPKQQKGNEQPKGKEKSGQQKKKDKKNILPKVSIEELYSNISEDEVKNHLVTVEILLPNSPLVWLKDLATFFNVKLNISVDIASLSSKPPGYPCSLLKKGVYKYIIKFIKFCLPQTLQMFYEFGLNALVQDTLKGHFILGYITLLQCIAQEVPSIVSSNLSKYAELCNAHSNRQNVCLLLWWLAGQVGNKDLETGFQIWLQIMFPMIGEKNCSSYAIEYLEELVRKAKNTEFKKNIIQVRDFFPILDLIYSKELPKGVQKRLMAVFPTFKLLSYGCEPENVLRNYFPSYLRRLEPHCSQQLKTEVLSSLVYCFEKDSHCFSVWRQLYTKHFIQSKCLIAHLNDQWNVLPPNFPKKSLKDTLSVFQVTNEELMSSSKKSSDTEECSLINKELLAKLNASSFSWLRAIIILNLFISILLTVDIFIHGSFAKSLSGKFMKDTGLMIVLVQTADKLSNFYGKILKLLQTYSPILFAWYNSTFLPYLELFIRELLQKISNVWSGTLGFRTWFNMQFPPLLDLVEIHIPYLRDCLITLLTNVSVLVLQYINFAWDSAESIVAAVQSNEHAMYLLDNMSKLFAIVCTNVQDYATHCAAYLQKSFQLSQK